MLIMSIVVLKKNLVKYFEKHGMEIMCSLSVLDDNSNAIENYITLR